ncbi:hypothetical protein PhCBS80983_g01547 [Powellomyces hirtus]|uniref:non-specific serine/threonine protein kinase n=1 Tax=Powellomyces hirtus TaxID=109895 RepID=A0A507EAQ9_9FUNG|nr:hypothetical protein PhCBS80983_g01547 [Powellomyces hirtus]
MSASTPQLAYSLLNPPIGRGTSGTVYRAYSKSDPTGIPHFAVKAIPRADLRKSRKQEQVVREISLLKRLCHPNIVKFVDLEWDASHVFIVMELCQLGSLKSYLARQRTRRLAEPEARMFLRQLAAGLFFLTTHSISHRDLKTENILLATSKSNPPGTFPVLKIADFGIADHPTASTNELKGASKGLLTEKIGTLLYMAPEILREDHYDARCDLWSVGVVFYEMLCGQPPFHPVTSIDTLLSQILSPIPPNLALPPLIAANTSAAAQNLVSALLTRSPTDRLSFQTLYTHSYLDLNHIPASDSLARGMERISLAMELEGRLTDETASRRSTRSSLRKGKDRLALIEELVDLYTDGIAHLLAYRTYLGPAHPGVGDLTNRIAEYMDKAEALKAETHAGPKADLQPALQSSEESGLPPNPLHSTISQTWDNLSTSLDHPLHASEPDASKIYQNALHELTKAERLYTADSPSSALPYYDRGLALLLRAVALAADDEERERLSTEACHWLDRAQHVRNAVAVDGDARTRARWKWVEGNDGGRVIVKRGDLIDVVYRSE